MDDEAAERRFREGLEALDRGDPRAALRIGRRLCRARYTGGDELVGRAWYELGEPYRAIAALQEGVRKNPDIAILWSYLGEFLSHQGRHEEAVEAFRKSAVGHGGSPDIATFNVAIELRRLGRFQEALAAVVCVGPHGPPLPQVQWLQAEIFLDLGETAEARPLLAAAMEAVRGEDDEAGWSRFLATRAALEYAEGLVGPARETAVEAVGFLPSNGRAADLIRRIDGLRSPRARLFRVLVHGRLADPLEGLPAAYFANYKVVAETRDQIHGFVAPFEARRASAYDVEEAEALDLAPDEWLGVLAVDPQLHLYRHDDGGR